MRSRCARRCGPADRSRAAGASRVRRRPGSSRRTTSPAGVPSDEQVEPGRRVTRIDERLRGERAGAAACVRTQRADREEPARDRDAEGARRRHGRGSTRSSQRAAGAREARPGEAGDWTRDVVSSRKRAAPACTGQRRLVQSYCATPPRGSANDRRRLKSCRKRAWDALDRRQQIRQVARRVLRVLANRLRHGQGAARPVSITSSSAPTVAPRRAKEAYEDERDAPEASPPGGGAADAGSSCRCRAYRPRSATPCRRYLKSIVHGTALALVSGGSVASCTRSGLKSSEHR